MTIIDYLGLATALGVYGSCAFWVGGLISDLTRPDED